MKKYFQIIFVLGGFFLLVFLKNAVGDQNETQPIISQHTPTPTQPQGTSTPSQSSSVPPVPTPTPVASSLYKDGTYTGSVADAYYGYVQVQVVIAAGKISDVTFLQYPSDQSTSRFINSQAMPMLKQEAIAAQSAQVDIVSGASDTSMAFVQSLSSALSNAK